VEWHIGTDHASSYAESFAGPDHWNLVDVIAVISEDHKAVGSRQGHTAAMTSDLQTARVAGAAERFAICRQAILERDFATFADLVERDSNLMHAVMMTSRPPLFYWLPTSLAIMIRVSQWRAEGLNVCYTLDAGPNVHCICTGDSADEVARRLEAIDGVRGVLKARPGSGAQIIAL
jgi:diphosphomevalonate decarboxylase